MISDALDSSLRATGYSDEKISQLTKEAIKAGFNHFKMKVGADLANDLRRGRLIRSIIDDPQYIPGDPEPARLPGSAALAGKNAGPTGAVLMIDANQVWDVPQAIDYVSSLAEIKPWCATVPLFVFLFPPSFFAQPREGRGRVWTEVDRVAVVFLGLLRSRRRQMISSGTRPYVAR